MKNKRYGKFILGDIFSIESSKSKINAISIEINDKKIPETIPYVVRTGLNNGIKGYVKVESNLINKGKTLSFGQDTATIFYQEKDYVTGDKIKIFVLKEKEMNYKIGMYFISLLNKIFQKFSWGNSSFSEKTIKELEIQLPIKDNIEEKEKYEIDDIDYEYMEERIKELEEERIKELEKYLEVSDLENYELTKEDEEVLGRKIEFKEFKVGEVFKVKNTKPYSPEQFEFNKDGYEFICASNLNNGLNKEKSRVKVSDDTKMTSANIIAWGKQCPKFTYHKEKCVAGQGMYYIEMGDKNESQCLYIIGELTNKCEGKYNYSKCLTGDKMKDEIIHLPVDKQGQIDYEYMNNYIQAIKKKTIAGVVKYKDQVIEITKKVVAKTK